MRAAACDYFLRLIYSMPLTALGATLLTLCVVVSIPWLTKVYAQKKVIEALDLSVKRYHDIANTYTEHGTPEELQSMIEDLEEVMEELQFLEKTD